MRIDSEGIQIVNIWMNDRREDGGQAEVGNIKYKLELGD